MAVCVLLHVVILSLSFFDNNQQEKYCRSIIPDREYQTDEDNRRFVFSAQEIKDEEDCLRFYTAHMEVSVYADDTLIYHVGQQQTPGSMTKKDIEAIKDPSERQAAIAQNIQLFQ